MTAMDSDASFHNSSVIAPAKRERDYLAQPLVQSFWETEPKSNQH